MRRPTLRRSQIAEELSQAVPPPASRDAVTALSIYGESARANKGSYLIRVGGGYFKSFLKILSPTARLSSVAKRPALLGRRSIRE